MERVDEYAFVRPLGVGFGAVALYVAACLLYEAPGVQGKEFVLYLSGAVMYGASGAALCLLCIRQLFTDETRNSALIVLLLFALLGLGVCLIAAAFL